MDIAYGRSATFLFDTVMIVVFPILGHWMGLSDAAFGLWAGTAVNDTSSVVATGYAFSEAAGDFATMVKADTEPSPSFRLFWHLPPSTYI